MSRFVFVALSGAFFFSFVYVVAIHAIRWATGSDFGYLPESVFAVAFAFEIICLAGAINGLRKSRSGALPLTVKQDRVLYIIAISAVALILGTYRLDIQLKRDIAEREHREGVK